MSKYAVSTQEERELRDIKRDRTLKMLLELLDPIISEVSCH